MKLYSNEIVFRGHPDKVADQIGDALLDAYLEQDPNVRSGIEVCGGKGKIFITGEVTTTATINIENIVKNTLSEIGYSTNYEIINNIGLQSPDIAQGVDIGGAGDQGLMFGYACNETEELLPKAMVILQEFSKAYEVLKSEYFDFLPDGKAQITGYYDEDFRLEKIKTFTISYQNKELRRNITDCIIMKKAMEICKKYEVEVDHFLINPTGKFLIGGFEGDAGVLGRKIVVDTYQSFANVGGGAFSGKDPTKVDRSAAYMARKIAKDYLRDYKLEWCQVQMSYAIGLEHPLSIYIDSNIGYIEPNFQLYFLCTPNNIIKELDLRKPQYYKTAQFGHFGDNNFSWEK